MALYRSPDNQTSFESIGLLVQEKFNTDFQMEAVWTILASFDLQVTLIFPMKFRVT